MRNLVASVALACTLLLGPSGAGIADPARPELVIGNDPGGTVSDHRKWWEYIRRSGVHVRIRGRCMSACTMVLVLPPSQVCVEPTATLGFHQAWYRDADGNRVVDPMATSLIAAFYYPASVKLWIKVHGPLTLDVVEMTAEEIVELGIFPACDDVPTS